MTDDNSDSDNGKLRRSFMREGAVATGGLALGLGTAGSVAGQVDGGFTEDGNDDDDIIGEQQWKGLIQAGTFQPAARFAFVSDVVEWTPTYGDIQDSWFSNYNTYQIRWQNTGDVVPFWVAQDAGIGEFDSDLGFVTDPDDDSNQPQLFEMSQEWTPFGDNPQLTTVNFSPVEEGVEDRILQDETWWESDEVGTNAGAGETAGNESAANESDPGVGDETAGNESDEGVLGNETGAGTLGNETNQNDGVF